ncbi:MAG TPA: energy transducer TonB [Paraburkholderia sp.]
MTNKLARAGAKLDARGPRIIVCLLMAVVIWGGFIACFIRGLWRVGPPPAPRRPVAFDVRIVRLPPPELPKPPAKPALPPARAQQRVAAAAAAAVPAAPAKSARAVQRSVAAPLAALAPPPDESRRNLPLVAPANTSPVAPSAPPVQSTTSAATSAATSGTPAHAGSSQADAPATSTTSGNGPAHAIIQPLPSLPDDLREDAFQAVATARFSIHPDGSVDVELIKPTHNPRLNQLLLDALKKWRFFPAMKNGQAVESSQGIRVHFNVD